MRTVQETRRLINEAAKEDWSLLKSELAKDANQEIVKVNFEVIYDKLGHDIILQAEVKVLTPGDSLLQVWLQDIHPGIWIPEYRPWVSSVVEFEASQKVESALCGLIDSKWRPEDSGQRYDALLWGYVQHNGNVLQFGPFEKELTYP
jgi:hypothetical protein